MAFEKYRYYFDIDPEYFPQINADIINNEPGIWKKFYPHDTFVKLIKDTISVISRRDKVSVWVEGAYGTGKSHAVLTLKKLLDASDEEVCEYFNRFPEQLSNDLLNQFQQLKIDEKRILTVHRYGSSSIKDDNDLVFAIQESTIQALVDNGIDAMGESALKNSTIKWLSDSHNKDYFNGLINKEYAEAFSGDNVEAIIKKLNQYEGEALSILMRKIMKVGKERRIIALSLDVDDLVEWIKLVIEENKLKAIVFIWDEFTEYFRNNMRALTGFQKLTDLSGSYSFYFIIVTHNVTHIFPESDKDFKKILDRFVNPICKIELPENTAFHLMGSAMEKNKDTVIYDEWEETVDDLYSRTMESRELIKKKAHITDNELKNILPIHPYAALLLKHISSAFDSNQRSMFDFIKNDRGDEIKGFQWFINNYSPDDDNPFLTVDLLWDFFYEKGKKFLSHEIRLILDSYERSSNNLAIDEQRVLKVVLLLQAISQKVGGDVELFIPNEKNINNVFEGSDLDIGAPSRIAEKLVRDKILYKKPLGGGKFQFSALINVGDSAAIEKFKVEIEKRNTSSLIQMGELSSAISLSGALKLRYEVRCVASNDFRSTINQLRNQEADMGNKITSVITFAKDDIESVTISKRISEAISDGSYNIVFIDASITPLGNDLYEQYVDSMANAMYQRGKDNAQANQYENNAKEVLKKWKNNIVNGEFIVYTLDNPDGTRVATIDQLYDELAEINRSQYSKGLETGKPVMDTMWIANSLASGVECGAKESTTGQYRSGNPLTKLENYIGEQAWEVEKYWIKNPHLHVSNIKKYVEDIIAESFKNEGRISIAKIYDNLKVAPYGFMPCNLTAFVLGFVLKEYTDDTYTWSDGLTNDVLTISKLKEMVSEIIKLQNTPNPRYKDKYIVVMTKENKAFIEASSKVFNISKTLCTSVEQTRERIRQKMKGLSFPLWCLKDVVDKETFKSDKVKMKELIDCFSGIANNSNYGIEKTDSDLAFAIGKLCLENKGIDDELKTIVTKEKCTEGMDLYLHSYDGGNLIALATEIGDGGQYINQVRKKFDADEANWLWNIETANKKIEEVILEYKIVVESNKIIRKNVSFENTIIEWCDRCDNIKISYQYAKNSWGDLSDLMEMLFNIKRTATLPDSNRESFLQLLIVHGESFKLFYNNQVKLFGEVCNFFLEQYHFSDEDIIEIYSFIPTGQFIQDKVNYQNTVKGVIEKFLKDSKEKQLKDLWKEKTNTNSPKEWSMKYKMPILCMIPHKELRNATETFNTINRKYPEATAIEKAIEYLERANFFDVLESHEYRENAFKKGVIKDYEVILTDIEKVKEYLERVITDSPYDWFSSPLVDKKLREMAEVQYTQNGCAKALEKIENMDVDDVKRYLKDLIKDNMIVGIEIIKDN